MKTFFPAMLIVVLLAATAEARLLGCLRASACASGNCGVSASVDVHSSHKLGIASQPTLTPPDVIVAVKPVLRQRVVTRQRVVVRQSVSTTGRRLIRWRPRGLCCAR